MAFAFAVLMLISFVGAFWLSFVAVGAAVPALVLFVCAIVSGFTALALE